MRKRFLAGACLTVLLLALTVPTEGSRQPRQFQSEQASVPLFLQARGWASIEMSRSGGMRPGIQTVSIYSSGEIRYVSGHYQAGGSVTDCSLQDKLSNEELRLLSEALRSAKLTSWRERYEDVKHPVCCDQPTTSLKVVLRGGQRPTKTTFNTSWYPGSSQLRPNDLVRLADLAQTLSDKVSGRCHD